MGLVCRGCAFCIPRLTHSPAVRLLPSMATAPAAHIVCTSQVARGAEQLTGSLAAERRLLTTQVWAQTEDSAAIQRLAYKDSGETQDFVDFARALCKRHPQAWHSSGLALHKCLGNPTAAVRLLLEVREQDPSNSEVCCYLARLQPNQAVQWYTKALAVNPNCFGALVGLADEQ